MAREVTSDEISKATGELIAIIELLDADADDEQLEGLKDSLQDLIDDIDARLENYVDDEKEE